MRRSAAIKGPSLARCLTPLHSTPLHLTHPLHSPVHRQEGGNAAPKPLQPMAPRAAPLCRRRSATNPWLCRHPSSPLFFPSVSQCSTATAHSRLHHFVHWNATRSRHRRSGPVEDTELAADEPRCPATYNSAHELPQPSATDSSRRRRPRAPLGEEFHARCRRPHGGAAALASSPMRASSTVGS